MQAARMLRGGLQQAFKSRTKVGRAANVGLGAGIDAIKRKDGRLLRQLGQRCLGIGWIETNSLPPHGRGPVRGDPGLELARHGLRSPRNADHKYTCSE